MGDVTYIDTPTIEAVPVDQVLGKAMDKELTEVLVIGFRKDSNEYYYASSEADLPLCLWLLEKCKSHLLLECETQR